MSSQDGHTLDYTIISNEKYQDLIKNLALGKDENDDSEIKENMFKSMRETNHKSELFGKTIIFYKTFKVRNWNGGIEDI